MSADTLMPVVDTLTPTDMLPAPDVSVVFGTCNRVGFLGRAVQSILDSIQKLSFEIVIVDAGSDDGTVEYLAKMQELYPECIRVIQQGARRGAVSAFNEGFNAARGTYVAAFNDDAVYIGRPVEYAIEILEHNRDVGQIAIPYVRHMCDNASLIPEHVSGTPDYQVVSLPVIGVVPYANFSVISKRLGDALHWWGDYYHYAGDTELSTRVWASGLQVMPLSNELESYVIHYEAQDKTRALNVETHLYNARWRGPNSPFLKVPRTQLFVPNAQEPQIGNQLRFMGGAKDKQRYQREPGARIYNVTPQQRHIVADDDDVRWLLSLRKGKHRLFTRI